MTVMVERAMTRSAGVARCEFGRMQSVIGENCR